MRYRAPACFASLRSTSSACSRLARRSCQAIGRPLGQSYRRAPPATMLDPVTHSRIRSSPSALGLVAQPWVFLLSGTRIAATVGSGVACTHFHTTSAITTLLTCMWILETVPYAAAYGNRPRRCVSLPTPGYKHRFYPCPAETAFAERLNPLSRLMGWSGLCA